MNSISTGNCFAIKFLSFRYLALSVCQKKFDQNGFVAEYEYRNLELNMPITDNEFEKGLKEYGF